jgi:hypothetical protein
MLASAGDATDVLCMKACEEPAPIASDPHGHASPGNSASAADYLPAATMQALPKIHELPTPMH